MNSTDVCVMTRNKIAVHFGLAFTSVILFFNNCGKFSSISPREVLPQVSIVSNAPPLFIAGSELNVLEVSVGCGYVNEPCVTVEICRPGSSSCVVVNNVLLDTGSYGLRIFSSALSSLALTQEIDASGHSLAECQSYADGSSQWGPVVRADVKMGGEIATNIPIQSVSASFGSAPSDCTNLDVGPSDAGFNGILGVGHFIYDCGTMCEKYSNNRVYFNCSVSSINCTNSSISVAAKYQVMNPVAALSTDNNGVILQLPDISPQGATGATGWLIFGIGTQSSNTPPSGVVTFPADSSNGNFLTTLGSITYSAFIDSGSNGLYFPTPSGMTVCSDLPGFFCPSPPQVLTATQMGYAGTPTQDIQFEIRNADKALNTYNADRVFNNIGGPFSSEFDWGLPFFLGRTIYVGLEPASASSTTILGKGPFWAY